MSDETEADVTDRDPEIEDEEGHGISVEGGGDAGASSPEESDDVEADREAEEPDEEDEMREEEAEDQENVDNHRDEEPFQS